MYTYLIGWSDQNKWYYGSRIGNKLPPKEDLWSKYFTSSKYVKQFREEHGEPDVIQIRKTFNCKVKCRLWEEKVLKKLQVTKISKWLNKNHSFAPPILSGPKNIWYKQNRSGIRNPHFGKKHKPETIELFKLINSGKNNPMYGKKMPETFSKRMSEVHKGKITSEETKRKISETKKRKHQEKMVALNG